MRTIINEPVKIRLDIDSRSQEVFLRCIRWQQRTYFVEEVGMKFSIRDGRKVLHVFCVNVGVLDMRLHIDADTLHTVLVEISDGLAD